MYLCLNKSTAKKQAPMKEPSGPKRERQDPIEKDPEDREMPGQSNIKPIKDPKPERQKKKKKIKLDLVGVDKF